MKMIGRDTAGAGNIVNDSVIEFLIILLSHSIRQQLHPVSLTIAKQLLVMGSPHCCIVTTPCNCTDIDGGGRCQARHFLDASCTESGCRT